MTITRGMFEFNNPSLINYPSMRRNILCSHSLLSFLSLVDGDTVTHNRSLWILNEDSTCHFTGLPSDYPSPFFIPTLTSAIFEPPSHNETDILLDGTLLLPCSLRWEISLDNGTNELKGEISEVVNESCLTVSLSSDAYSLYMSSLSADISLTYGEEGTQHTNSISLKNTTHRNRVSRDTHSNNPTGTFLAFTLLFVALFILSCIIALVMRHYCKSYKSRSPKMETDFSEFTQSEEIISL